MKSLPILALLLLSASGCRSWHEHTPDPLCPFEPAPAIPQPPKCKCDKCLDRDERFMQMVRDAVKRQAHPYYLFTEPDCSDCLPATTPPPY